MISNFLNNFWLVPPMFWGSGIYGMLCFGTLAQEWPILMKQWESVEAKLPKFRTKQEKRKMAFHMKMLAFVVLLCSLGRLTGIILKKVIFHMKYF